MHWHRTYFAETALEIDSFCFKDSQNLREVIWDFPSHKAPPEQCTDITLDTATAEQRASLVDTAEAMQIVADDFYTKN